MTFLSILATAITIISALFAKTRTQARHIAELTQTQENLSEVSKTLKEQHIKQQEQIDKGHRDDFDSN